MPKRASLSGAISAAAHGKPADTPKPTPKAPAGDETAPPPKVVEKPAEKATRARASTRAGKKAIYAWVDPAIHRSLRTMNLDTGRTVDELVGDAVKAMLKQEGYLKK